MSTTSSERASGACTGICQYGGDDKDDVVHDLRTVVTTPACNSLSTITIRHPSDLLTASSMDDEIGDDDVVTASGMARGNTAQVTDASDRCWARGRAPPRASLGARCKGRLQ